MAEDPSSHLKTKYVFVDTQAYRRARFDWTGRSLSKLAEFADKGHLQLLVTDVTVREIKSQLRELVAEASRSLAKHSGLLGQLGASQAVEALKDETAAVSSLEAAFDQFLKSAKAVHVPLISDVKGVLDDYFARQPPFSTKKKFEFPDAISIASVRVWCEQNSEAAYVVSEDPDLQGCCSESGPFHHAKSIAEIISQATVSQELHDKLANALRASDYLSDSLAEEIRDTDVRTELLSPYGSRAAVSAAAINDVDSINIVSVDLLTKGHKRFAAS